jgi:hypothetical protein
VSFFFKFIVLTSNNRDDDKIEKIVYDNVFFMFSFIVIDIDFKLYSYIVLHGYTNL